MRHYVLVIVYNYLEFYTGKILTKNFIFQI